MRNTSKRIQVLVNNACITTWDLLPEWKTTSLLQRQVKKQCKGSHGPKNTHGIFVLATIRVLTNKIVSQEDTTECGEYFQPFD